MSNVKVYNMKGQAVSELELGALFELEYNEPLTVPYNSSGFQILLSEIVRYFNNQSPPNKTVHRITAINAFTLTLIFL